MKRTISLFFIIAAIVALTSCVFGTGIVKATIKNETGSEISIYTKYTKYVSSNKTPEEPEYTETEASFTLEDGSSYVIEHCGDNLDFELSCNGVEYSGQSGLVDFCTAYKLRFYFDGDGELKSETSYKSFGKMETFSIPLHKL